MFAGCLQHFIVCVLISTLLIVKPINGAAYTNPVIDYNTPDPGVLALPDGSGYVLVSTSNYAERGIDPLFPIHFSTNLVDWELITHVFLPDSWPVWAKKDFWAPEIHFVNGTYYVYFSAYNNDPTCHVIIPGSCHTIGVAISQTGDPFGPYIDYGEAILDGEFGVIDITWFKDPMTENTYLSWKDNPNFASSIHIRQVESDGITFREEWPDVKVIQSDLIHDLLVTEGPWIIYREPYYYLFFSTHLFTGPHYQTEVARSKNVLGPYERLSTPITHTDYDRYLHGINCTFVGPGHGSTVTALDGTEWYLYHAWRYEHVNEDPPGRVLLLDKLRWDELPDGPWPFIGVPSDTSQPAPVV